METKKLEKLDGVTFNFCTNDILTHFIVFKLLRQAY